MMDQIIYNLTQHQALPEQTAQGVQDLEPEDRNRLRSLLTFDEIPSQEEMEKRAETIVAQLLPWDADAAMIGGAPYFMAPLEKSLKARNVRVLYAFSKRESRDEIAEDGSCRKVAVFRHIGFVEA